ncbi:MAG: ligase [Alicyclobacillaceae bacterium]|jgi:octanoyl-[GcvH]:protein N-octanoyltransferase|nr:ligase [Alicyclobacillaceae bacterium]MCY0895026.1 ligase [Alicyclobacillaceae bacterium]
MRPSTGLELMRERDILLWPQEVEVAVLELDDAEANLQLDDVLGEQVGRGERSPLLRIWRHAKVEGLVVSRRDVALPAAAAAAERMRAWGYPVFVRGTGGTAVPHGRTVLNLSLIFPRIAEPTPTTDALYRLLCQPLLNWLWQLGMAGTVGPVPDSYCDGSYNVIVQGKKLAGTAQTWRGGLAGLVSSRPGYILAHACIPIDSPLDRYIQAINRFYEQSGNAYRANLETATTLAMLQPDTDWTSVKARDSLVATCQSFVQSMKDRLKLLEVPH